jgi:hypothetical protein
MTTPRELSHLRHRLSDLVKLHPPRDWSPALITAVVASLDLHFAEGGTNKAPLLELVRR